MWREGEGSSNHPMETLLQLAMNNDMGVKATGLEFFTFQCKTFKFRKVQQIFQLLVCIRYKILLIFWLIFK